MPSGEDVATASERFKSAFLIEQRLCAESNRKLSLFRILWREYGVEWARTGVYLLVSSLAILFGPLYLNSLYPIRLHVCLRLF